MWHRMTLVCKAQACNLVISMQQDGVSAIWQYTQSLWTQMQDMISPIRVADDHNLFDVGNV